MLSEYVYNDMKIVSRSIATCCQYIIEFAGSRMTASRSFALLIYMYFIFNLYRSYAYSSGLFKPTKSLSTDDDVINDEPQAEVGCNIFLYTDIQYI